MGVDRLNGVEDDREGDGTSKVKEVGPVCPYFINDDILESKNDSSYADNCIILVN